MGQQVLLYWPNIIGYVRIGFLITAWTAHETPAFFVFFYSISIALDGVDGWLARRLGQTSRFGAWLDVVVDNVGRGMLWSLLFKWGWLVSAVEWCVFVCNHNARGDHWKNSFSSSPRLIRAIMNNGFRTPLGLWVVSGLHCLPLWLYGSQKDLLSHWMNLPPSIQNLVTLLLCAGRLLALSAEVDITCEHQRGEAQSEFNIPSLSLSKLARESLKLQLWCIRTHIEYLTSEETEDKKS